MGNKKLSTYGELFWSFFKIGALTFGGGAAMISFMSAEAVDKKKWITDEEMLDIVTVAESTPGPIAVNTSTFVGYRAAGTLGSIIATLGTVLPPFMLPNSLVPVEEMPLNKNGKIDRNKLMSDFINKK